MSEEAVVYIVDDDAAARESVAALVRSRGMAVREFNSAEAFLAEYKDDHRGCLLIEARLPGMSGLELQQHLRASGRTIPTVVITGAGNIATAVKAMQNGAVTFLEKSCEQKELWQSIELALQRAKEQKKSAQWKSDLRERFSKLTASERAVLARVMEGQPNRRIATELKIGLRTVELRRAHIMCKTGAASLSALIRLAIEVDFRDLPTPVAKDSEPEDMSE